MLTALRIFRAVFHSKVFNTVNWFRHFASDFQKKSTAGNRYRFKKVTIHSALNPRNFHKQNNKIKPLYTAILRYTRAFATFPITHFKLVEATRIELVSESPFMQLSTSVYYLLKFPWETAGKRAETQSSPYTIQRHGHAVESFTTNRCPYESRGNQSQDSSWLRQLPVHYF